MKSCSKIKDLLGPYHDGELGARKRAYLEAHLAKCADCTEELEWLGSLGPLLMEPINEAADKVSFEGLWERVADRLEQERKPPLMERTSVFLREFFYCHRTALASGLVGAALVFAVLFPIVHQSGDGIDKGATPIILSLVNECLVDHVESASGTVLISQDPNDQTTVIWLLDDQGMGGVLGDGVNLDDLDRLDDLEDDEI